MLAAGPPPGAATPCETQTAVRCGPRTYHGQYAQDILKADSHTYNKCLSKVGKIGHAVSSPSQDSWGFPGADSVHRCLIGRLELPRTRQLTCVCCSGSRRSHVLRHSSILPTSCPGTLNQSHGRPTLIFEAIIRAPRIEDGCRP